MEIDTIYQNVEEATHEGKAQQNRCRCLVLAMVILGIICVILLVFVTLQHIRADSNHHGLFFIYNETNSWSESRQFCRDRGGDLIIINTEEKQRFISPFVEDYLWIGLTDVKIEGNMKWVDNSPLKQGFWIDGEPNNLEGENCVIIAPVENILKNWNDAPCTYKFKALCEK
ncbi:C-type lectin domain family 4 member E-like isoform X2 [Danio aesculapii]|uniref:C-type lectin domain family 4 member E-like isoform X2 n=1 Tax=Danio aesculapii TaxID=1142201 RepID=UPI0024BF9DC7|nr:C-type lectin domain family 4 member E-like isoform X2 [Danio aesculapii]